LLLVAAVAIHDVEIELAGGVLLGEHVVASSVRGSPPLAGWIRMLVSVSCGFELSYAISSWTDHVG
jgi:hypothetical protein